MKVPPPYQCASCGTSRENLEFCSMCNKYFCPTCKHRYPQRVAAMMREKVFDPIGDFFGALGFK